MLSGQRKGNAMYHVAPESLCICRTVMYEIGHKGRQLKDSRRAGSVLGASLSRRYICESYWGTWYPL